jgi:acyl-CoA reductase-like NAD-dependent aldehyde dehydrogenase
MIEVVQAFDRTPITQLASDDAASLEEKITTARRLFKDRGAWLKPYERIEILRRLAVLMEGRREHLGRQIAREGGKPLTDALVEADRAIDRHAACCRRPGDPDGADAGECRPPGLHHP